MVFDFDSTHKKPYEPLIIGQFHKNKEGSKDKKLSVKELPETQVVCSVPCSLHSRKPPVNGM